MKHWYLELQSCCSLQQQVQIRPWNLNDSDFVMDGSQPLDPRKTIFVGGVPRPLRAGILVPPALSVLHCHIICDYVITNVIKFSMIVHSKEVCVCLFVFCGRSGAGYDHGQAVWWRVLRRD